MTSLAAEMSEDWDDDGGDAGATSTVSEFTIPTTTALFVCLFVVAYPHTYVRMSTWFMCIHVFSLKTKSSWGGGGGGGGKEEDLALLAAAAAGAATPLHRSQMARVEEDLKRGPLAVASVVEEALVGGEGEGEGGEASPLGGTKEVRRKILAAATERAGGDLVSGGEGEGGLAAGGVVGLAVAEVTTKEKKKMVTGKEGGEAEEEGGLEAGEVEGSVEEALEVGTGTETEKVATVQRMVKVGVLGEGEGVALVGGDGGEEGEVVLAVTEEVVVALEGEMTMVRGGEGGLVGSGARMEMKVCVCVCWLDPPLMLLLLTVFHSPPAPKPRPDIYVPPLPPDDEETIFSTISKGINFDKYDDIPVEATGRDPPKAIASFDEVSFFETTKKAIEKCGYTKPTPVQKYSIPIVLAGRDLMSCAQTGSGKTVSYEKNMWYYTVQ